MAELHLSAEDFKIFDQVQKAVGLTDEQFLRFLRILDHRDLATKIQTHQIDRMKAQREAIDKQMAQTKEYL